MSNSCLLRIALSTLLISAGLRAMTAGHRGDEMDLVVPVMLSRNDVHLLQDVFGRSKSRRGQRSAAESKTLQSNKEGDDLFIMLPAFGRQLYLHLQRGAGFLSEGCVIEETDVKGTIRVTNISDDRLCFYTGRVLNHTNSFASVSTCGGGLTGLVGMGDDHMFIEPVAGSQDSFSGVQHRVKRQRGHPISSPPTSETHSKYCQPLPGRREKREATRESGDGRGQGSATPLRGDYTVETVVVADADMVQYHGVQTAKRFILTVMNMVHSMFQHGSLGVSVSIRLTKIVLLHSRPESLKVGHHGERSLHSFCRWQHQEFGYTHYLGNNQVPGGKEGPPAVDVAVLVTRRRCVLAEDNGLNLPFTIAHELGHSLGISHDDDHASCTSHSHIMSGEWVKGRNPSGLSWSNCSRDDLEKFLRSNASACLLHTDPRSHTTARLPSKLPGMHYSADEQCQILFGTNATFCKDMEHLMCAGLWCLVERNETCQTKLDPPLDGTECGTDKWCRAGSCVSKAPLPQHADGDWGTWGSWSTCGRTCGTGARFRQRKCDNPPPGPKGKPCQGSSVEQRVCQGPPCNKRLPTFRDQQCQSYANKHATSMWTAVVNDEKPCALFCSPVGQDAPVLVSERVLDGTPCGPYETDLCVSGQCLRVGCDGIIGSSAEEDHCGVCGGDSQSCEVVKGQFNQSTGHGYIEAVLIPIGAWRIKVVESEPSHSFLALKDSSNGSINSDWKIELPGEFELAGTTVRYVRRGLWEKMSAKGPTKTPLHLMVLLFHDQNYSIQYEYTVSLNHSLYGTAVPDEAQQGDTELQEGQTGSQQGEPRLLYVWAHSHWEDCSVHCGGGERKTVVSCTVVVNETLSVVNDSYCHPDNRPLPEIRRCNTHLCPSKWVAGAWGACSVTCGVGLQVREVACVYQLQNGSYALTLARPCPGPKPPPTQSCETPSCPAHWETSDWTKCSTECGLGIRKRNVTCISQAGDICDPATRPTEEEPCEDQAHCNEWKTGHWSKCSSTCGRAFQSRVVHCMHKVTGRHGDDCPVYYKPPTSRQCNQGPCVNHITVSNIVPPRTAALTQLCRGDQWPSLCRVIQEKRLCQDRKWYQLCCQTCGDPITNRTPHNS
ncbi:hypothetical protein AGOR_G00002560 [Albula goreensis]|uniref:Uncharacterized protein n=1 Tax=Albula goreensis TaxID=1534307 RepID=A0A8T3E7Y8_9TELE|nr:hypothetical protein AGOR_G00002560 [Albula goreensis]